MLTGISNFLFSKEKTNNLRSPQEINLQRMEKQQMVS